MKTETEIKEYFKSISDLKEAKTIYRNLAKQLHPDTGGTNEDFKILNNVYNDYLNNNLYFASETKINLDLEKIISQILHYEDLIIEIVGEWIWLSGETKAIKEHLKDLGFKWRSKKKMWSYGEMKSRNNKPQSMEHIKAKYGSQTVATKQNFKIAA